MSISALSLHLMNREVPEVVIAEYGDFSTVEIKSNGLPEIKFFLYSPQQVTNFKNNFLWAFEDPIDQR